MSSTWRQSQGWVPWTHNTGIPKSRKWQNITTAQNSRKWHLLALMIIHSSLLKGLLMYYCGMGWGGRYWRLCSLIRADLVLVEQRQQIFTWHKMHISLRDLKSIRGFSLIWGWQRAAARQCSNCTWGWDLGSAGSQQRMPELGLMAAEILNGERRTEVSHSWVFWSMWTKLGTSE